MNQERRSGAAVAWGVDELRADRDLEKKLRKDAEHALCDAAELLEDIMRGKVNPEDEAEKWLRAYDPIRLNRRTDETPNDQAQRPAR